MTRDEDVRRTERRSRVLAVFLAIALTYSLYVLWQALSEGNDMPFTGPTPTPTPSEALRSPLLPDLRTSKAPAEAPSTTRQEDPVRVVVVPQPVPMPGPQGRDGRDGQSASSPPQQTQKPSPSPSPSPSRPPVTVCIPGVICNG